MSPTHTQKVPKPDGSVKKQESPFTKLKMNMEEEDSVGSYESIPKKETIEEVKQQMEDKFSKFQLEFRADINKLTSSNTVSDGKLTQDEQEQYLLLKGYYQYTHWSNFKKNIENIALK